MATNLYSTIIRTNKNDASFLYFLLESHEGLCFYSTRDESLQQPYRDIEIHCTAEFKKPLRHLLERFALQHPTTELEYQPQN